MKRFRRISALLALVMLLSLALAGCGKKEEPIAADQVAEAMFDIAMKKDASKIVELFGYTDEAAVFTDWGIDKDSFFENAENALFSQFSDIGYTATAEELRAVADSYWEIFSKIQLTARVKAADEKTGAAVVTCTVNTVAPGAIEEAVIDAVAELPPELLINGEMEDIFGQMLSSAAAVIREIEPTDRTVDFDVDFELVELDVCGKIKQAWMPKDSGEYSFQILAAATGGWAGADPF